MRIVIAPDSFKESLSAIEVADEIERGFRMVWPDAAYTKLPMADGGEGTVEALMSATGGRIVTARITGPLGKPVDGFFGLAGDVAVIEMAAACGLALIEPRARNPFVTTTYGVGELMLAALDAGARHLIVGIGGSSTNDGGAGMIQALGGRLLDAGGQQIGFGGGELGRIAAIDLSDLDRRLADCRIEVACDVTNPLTGPNGASAIFGPQKGASDEMIAALDRNLLHFAAEIERHLGIAVGGIAGAGAAGGVGAGMIAFLGAELRPGIDIVIAATGLEAAIAGADLVITGEGRLDSQSIQGKTPIGVARLAKRHRKPVVAIAGCLSRDADVVLDHGIDMIFSVLDRPCTVEEAFAEAAPNLRRRARNVAEAIRLGMTL